MLSNSGYVVSRIKGIEVNWLDSKPIYEALVSWLIMWRVDWAQSQQESCTLHAYQHTTFNRLPIFSTLQCESKNPPLRFSDIFFQNGWEFLVQILHTYYSFVSTLQIFIQLSATLTKLCHIKHDHPVHIICSMPTIGRNARLQMFAKVIDSFVDCCLWQVIPDLLQCTFELWGGLWLRLKFVKCLKHHTPHMVVEWAEWGLVSLVDIGPLHNLLS